MVCIYCGDETRVINSRHQKRNNKVWRRRACTQCRAIFTTLEAVEATSAFTVAKDKRFKPFSRDQLLLSLYDSLRHRKTAITDATALTDTIIGQLYPFINSGVLQRDSIVEISHATLERFDTVASIHYQAYHPTQ